jgi:hypothetical protein
MSLLDELIAAGNELVRISADDRLHSLLGMAIDRWHVVVSHIIHRVSMGGDLLEGTALSHPPRIAMQKPACSSPTDWDAMLTDLEEKRAERVAVAVQEQGPGRVRLDAFVGVDPTGTPRFVEPCSPPFDPENGAKVFRDEWLSLNKPGWLPDGSLLLTPEVAKELFQAVLWSNRNLGVYSDSALVDQFNRFVTLARESGVLQEGTLPP